MGSHLPVPIQVECYAGSKGEETPQAIVYKGRRSQIVDVVERWCEESIKAGSGRRSWFVVKMEDRSLAMIYRDESLGVWFWAPGKGSARPDVFESP